MKNLVRFSQLFLAGGSLLGVIVLPPGVARGEDRIWLPASGSWSSPSSWGQPSFPANIPAPDDNALFGTGTYAVTVNGNTIKNVISEGGPITFNLAGAFTVTDTLNGSLTFTGGGGTASVGTLIGPIALNNGAMVTASNAQLGILNMTASQLRATNLQLSAVGSIAQGSTLTSTTATLSAGTTLTLNGSTWDNSAGKFTADSGRLTLSNGAQLKSASALLDASAKVTVDATTHWENTGNLTLLSAGQLLLTRGGNATVGGNLIATSDGSTGQNGAGGAYLNSTDTTGASRLDVTGRVEASAGGGVGVGTNATLTSRGVVTRGGDNGNGIINGGGVSVSGTLTNTGTFVIGESGQNTSASANSLSVGDGGTVTTTGDLIVGQASAFNTLDLFSNSTLRNVNGVLAQNAGSNTTATIGFFGETNARWINSGTLTVADAGTASLRIDTGGNVTNTAATVGNQAGSVGSVNLRGGGIWTSSGNLTVGAANGSTGTVLVDFGGILNVNGTTLTLGRDAGSDGTLTLGNLTNKGTQFNFTGDLQVGLAGDGTLNITSGFSLDQGAKSLVLGGQATSTGTLHVTDANSVYRSTNLTVGSLGVGILKVENGGLVRNTGNATLGELSGGAGSTVNGTASVLGTGTKWQVDGNLVVGLAANTVGKVTVMDGATLMVGGQFLTLAQEAGSKGTLTLDGVGSRFTSGVGTSLEIGRHGDGTLVVKNGASLALPSTILGVQNDGSGTLTVTGKGANNGPASLFQTNGSLTVGGASKGTLNITGGGQVVTDLGAAIIGRDQGVTGTVTLAAQGSQWMINSANDPVGGAVPGSLTVGQQGTGVFNVNNQAAFTAGAVTLGQNASGTGTLTVTGSQGASDANVTVRGALTVGDAGMGTLTFTDGAKLMTTADATLGKQADSQGFVRLRGDGTTWTLGGKSLTVGQAGFGNLNVSEKARLVDTTATVAAGLLQNGFGSVVVDGDGTLLQVKTLGLGGAGDGLLQVSNGAKVIVDGLVTGAANGTGRATVDGTAGGNPSTLQIKDLSLGKSDGNSPLVISDGGLVTISGVGGNATVEFAANTDIVPDVFVTGSGSQLRVTAPTLNVGNATNRGSLGVNDGAVVSAGTVAIADRSRVDVGGPSPSRLTASGRLEVGPFGGNGNGILDVSDNGQVTAPGVLVTGQVNVHGQGATLTANGGAFDLESGLLVGRGSVAVSSGGNVTVAGPLSVGVFGASSVTVAGTGTQLRAASATVGGSGTGSLATSDGGHVAIGGLLAVRRNGTLSTAGGGSVDIGPALFDQAPSGQVRVGAGGRLKVDGSVTGDVFNFGGTVGGSGTINGKLINAGTVAVGDPQTLTINGDYTQLNGGVLFMTLGGTNPSDYDHLNVTGTLTLMSGSILELDFLNGFAPKLGDRFDFLAFGTLDPLNAAFSQVNVTGLQPGFLYALAPDGLGSYSLTALNDGVAAIPEPRTWLLVAVLGALALMGRRSRSRQLP